MGLLRTASRRDGGASWANNSASNIYRKEKRAFCDSMSTHETTPCSTTDDASYSTTRRPTATSHSGNDVDALSEKVQLLELQLQRKDETISHLRQGMQAEDERVTLLERQLGRLVELSSNQCAAHQGTTFSNDSKKVNRKSVTAGDCDDPLVDEKLEISALQELLARVIAEKDRLWSQNHSLKRLLMERNNRACRCSKKGTGGIKKMPSTIDQLDRMVQEKEHKKKCQRDECQDTINSHDECQRDSPKEDVIEILETKNGVPAAAAAEEHHTILYQLSCDSGKCPKDHSHLRYKSTYTSTRPSCLEEAYGGSKTTDNAKRELSKTLKKHCTQVWKMVQQHQDDGGSISSSVHDDEIDFSSSSLARHLVKHCQSMSNKDDVLKWCKKNVIIEIQQDVYSADVDDNRAFVSPQKKMKERKSRSKSRSSKKNHKQRRERGCSF